MGGRFFRLLVLMAVVLPGVSGAVRAQEPVADARGNWTIYSKNIDNGAMVTKHVQIHQNGNQLSGRFEGPNQSGGIQGFVNGRHIEFSTKTREVLTFRGQIDGNQMSGFMAFGAGMPNGRQCANSAPTTSA